MGAGAETGTEKRGAAEGAAAMDVVLDSGRAAELAGEAARLGAEAPPAAAETAGGLTSAEPPDPVAPNLNALIDPGWIHVGTIVFPGRGDLNPCALSSGIHVYV